MVEEMMDEKKFVQREMNRRDVMRGAAATAAVLGAKNAFAGMLPSGNSGGNFGVDVMRSPDAVEIFLGLRERTRFAMQPRGGKWIVSDAAGGGAEMQYEVNAGLATASLLCPGAAAQRVHLRWNGLLREDLLVLGDAWERSYGDLQWQTLQPTRVLPWYCAVQDGPSSTGAGATHGFGVAIGAASFAFWQVDERGISLWLDVRNGGNGVQLGNRKLTMATVVTHSSVGNNSFAAVKQLCVKMADAGGVPRREKPLLIYGSNDWYYAYGKSSEADILRDADLMQELAPMRGARPFTVVDEGYANNKLFGDMASVAEKIRARNVRPGLWIRPLRADATSSKSWLMPAARGGRRPDNEPAYDPTNPEGLEAALAVVRQAAAWGYELIKHDFTTYDLLGQWGFAMGASPAMDGWNFYDGTRTSAQIIRDFYVAMRKTAGAEKIILGCNTVLHLGAGIFDTQRTGDDVSGRDWSRTRKMGVNTLAFRQPQHNIFHVNDPDCVPLSAKIPWTLTEQWLRVVAGSGTALIISPEASSVGAEQKAALRNAFAELAAGGATAEPTDWMETITPEAWRRNGKTVRYNWTEPEGASPF